MTKASLLTAAIAITATLTSSASFQRFRHVPSPQRHRQHTELQKPYIPEEQPDTATLTGAEMLDTITPLRPASDFAYAAVLAPWVLNGYRHLEPVKFKAKDAVYEESTIVNIPADSVPSDSMPSPEWIAIEEDGPSAKTPDFSRPEWLARESRSRQFTLDMMHSLMTFSPLTTEYTYWDLPEPVRLPDDDLSFKAFLQRLDLPEIDNSKAKIEIAEIEKRHWLHVFNAGLHFSQAFVSPNWYQGGNNYLAVLINFLWDVSLNQVYHPNLMFQNTVSYKLGLNSNPSGQMHKYNISEDIFQWNMKAGVKAFKKWFYSFNLQFKTQMLVNYPSDSWPRKASFLAPGDLNLGVGMTYSTSNKKNTIKFNASVSPVSYNLKTCIDTKIDPVQFNVPIGKKFHNEIGSNAELTLTWKWASNIEYRSRLFLFTNYDYFLSDWENTISFNINRFLSTQIYVHLRYDSSSEISNNKWKHLMLKEILSFGFSYAFSTKQK